MLAIVEDHRQILPGEQAGLLDRILLDGQANQLFYTHHPEKCQGYWQ
jgi:hypothetical protein